MLLKITEHCSMGCCHCLSRCTKNNEFMDENVFDQVIKFIQSHSIGVMTIIVSGGEPTEHQLFEIYMKKLVEGLRQFIHIQIYVVTNGLWMVTHFGKFKKLYDELSYNTCGKQVFWQVTNDPIYYPRDIGKINRWVVTQLGSLDYVAVFRKLQRIYPQGRAEDNNLEWTAKGPKCFNIRTASGHVESFMELLSFMASMGISCSPCIEWDGTLKLGESYLCTPCSSIWKSDIEIMNDIRSFKCMKCGKAISQLPIAAKSIMK